MDSGPPRLPPTTQSQKAVRPSGLCSPLGLSMSDELKCLDPESNQGHGDFQSPALPSELSRRTLRAGVLRSTAAERKPEKPSAAGTVRRQAPASERAERATFGRGRGRAPGGPPRAPPRRGRDAATSAA